MYITRKGRSLCAGIGEGEMEERNMQKEQKIGQKFTVKWKNEYDRKYVLRDKRLNEINLIEKKQFDLVV